MTIAWIVTTLIALAGLTLAILTYRGKSAASFKRLHYTSRSGRFILPEFDDDAAGVAISPVARLRDESEDLILPHVVLLRIENTGRAPINPDDFSGPLNINFGEMAIFRRAAITSNRDGVFDPKHTEVEREAHGHLSFSPFLLNPGDSLTFACLVDGIIDVNVSARISGVESIVSLSPPTENQGTMEMNITSPIYEKRIDWPVQRLAHCSVTIAPILVDPSQRFSSEVSVRILDCLFSEPYMVALHIERQDGISLEQMQAGGSDKLSLNLGDCEIKTVMVRQGDDEKYWSPAAVKGLVSWKAGHLDIGKELADSLDRSIVITAFVESRPAHLNVVTRPPWVDNIVKFEIGKISTVDECLASTRPRILLSNRRLYVLWYRSREKFDTSLVRIRNWLTA